MRLIALEVALTLLELTGRAIRRAAALSVCSSHHSLLTAHHSLLTRRASGHAAALSLCPEPPDQVQFHIASDTEEKAQVAEAAGKKQAAEKGRSYTPMPNGELRCC